MKSSEGDGQEQVWVAKEIPQRSQQGRKPAECGFLEAKISVSWKKAGYIVSCAAEQLNNSRAENGSLDLTTWRSSVILAKKYLSGELGLEWHDLRKIDRNHSRQKDMPRNSAIKRNRENRVIARRECGDKRGFCRTGDNWCRLMCRWWWLSYGCLQGSLPIALIFTFIRTNVIWVGGIGGLKTEVGEYVA